MKDLYRYLGGKLSVELKMKRP
ncbi:hypothetical protein Gogos_010514 [Gossypium gossypioides]|uniref:Uncharacterized protein n=1 Tax=Gossypium gossypioides TaxID=34282 RepID=A0A7J9BLH7_GOSGO|nr:hypothetical protein [Gossypium gossypioides]